MPAGGSLGRARDRLGRTDAPKIEKDRWPYKTTVAGQGSLPAGYGWTLLEHLDGHRSGVVGTTLIVWQPGGKMVEQKVLPKELG